MTDERQPDMDVAELRITAAQVDSNCPDRLKTIGLETAKHLEACCNVVADTSRLVTVARKKWERLIEDEEHIFKALAEAEHNLDILIDHTNTINELVCKATTLCDESGLEAFKKQFLSGLMEKFVEGLLKLYDEKRRVRVGYSAQVDN